MTKAKEIDEEITYLKGLKGRDDYTNHIIQGLYKARVRAEDFFRE